MDVILPLGPCGSGCVCCCDLHDSVVVSEQVVSVCAHAYVHTRIHTCGYS